MLIFSLLGFPTKDEAEELEDADVEDDDGGDEEEDGEAVNEGALEPAERKHE